MRKTGPFLLSFLLWAGFATGQTFRYEAALPPVATEGFYKIALTPHLAARVKTDFSDIRLYGPQQQEVPYLVVREQPAQTRKLFREYEMVSKTLVPGGNTTLILRNPARTKINNISLLIKNTNVRKKAQLSGSNDAQTWYGLEDGYYLHSLYNQTQTAEVNLLNFPLSDYEFYRLIINDSASAPLNILSAGYYDTFSENGKYTPVPGLKFTQTDSSALKQTFVFFPDQAPVHADKLTFEITGPTYYRRQATLYQAHYQRIKRRRKPQKVYEPVAIFQLQSDKENTVLLHNFKSRDFYLVIHNQDNPPLQIRRVQFHLLNTFLVAALQKDKAYRLAFGNEELPPPVYDLTYFKEALPAGIPVISPANPKPIAVMEPASATVFKDKNIIWVAIVLVIALLGFMSYRMMQETAKK
jgi:hypothetical protein